VPGALARRVEATNITTDKLRFDHAEDGAVLVTRTSALIEAYCEAVIGGALAGDRAASLPRCGAAFTDAVTRRTAVLLLRLRYELVEEGHAQFAEEIVIEAFTAENDRVVWQHQTSRELLDGVRPAANMTAAERTRHATWALALLQNGDSTEPVITRHAAALVEAHRRARRLERRAILEVRPHVPPDVVGCFVLVPAGRT
jgi:hypothetical protein